MNPSPVHPNAAHVDGTAPQRHYSKVYHRDHPGQEIATFCDLETHQADAEAFIQGELARVVYTMHDWHYDDGDVLWWAFPVEEPPYFGTPGDDDFPSYVTHWTRIQVPKCP